MIHEKSTSTKRKLLLVSFLFAFFLFGKTIEASPLIQSEIRSNNWYIRENNADVACPTGSPNSWERFVNNVSMQLAQPFFCAAPPWISFAGNPYGSVTGDVIRFEFWSGGSLNGTNIGHIEAVWTGTTAQAINPDTTDHFISFTYSTTTQLAHLTGYITVIATPNTHTEIEFWQTTQALGQENYKKVVATSTGYFSYDFFFAGLPTSTSTINSLIQLKAVMTFVDQTAVDTTCNPFNGTNCGELKFIEDATSTSFRTFEYKNIGIQPDVPRTTYSFSECTLAHLDFGLCIGDIAIALFVPLDSDWNKLVEDTKNNLSTAFPIGYIYDFFDIMSTSTSGSLTVLDATFPSALGFGEHTIHLDVAHSLDYILNATTGPYRNNSASSTQTFYQITSGYWKIAVYLLTLFYLLGRILGSGIIPRGIKKQ